MSLGLTKPGMRSANLTGKIHPKTGLPLVPLGYLKNGTAVWPVLGASSDDEDDPAYVGGDSDPVRSREETDEDDEEDDEEDDPKPKPKSKKKEEDDEEREPTRPERQAARYRTRLREAEARERALEERLRKIEDSDKPADELMTRDLTEARSRIEALTGTNRVLSSQLAFFKSNTIDWVDPSDAFALADRAGMFDDLIDEDGNVDTRELQRGLRELAKQKPHLVKKSRAQDEDNEDEEQGSRSGSTMNGRRKGSRKEPDRAALAKRFPVLGR